MHQATTEIPLRCLMMTITVMKISIVIPIVSHFDTNIVQKNPGNGSFEGECYDTVKVLV